MGQIKIFGLKKVLGPHRDKVSDVVHTCLVDIFKIPVDKKFHRFILLEEEDFYFPADRTEKYTIIELSIFEGRSVEAKKELVRILYSRFQEQLDISGTDLEVTIFETPRYNWGIRGMPADELTLSYKVNL